MEYVLFFVSLALAFVPGYLIVQDDHSSSEGEREFSLEQRMDDLEANLAKLQKNTEHRNNCTDLVVVFIILTTPAPINACPDGWLPYNGSCYYFGRENIIFERAKELCAAQNASLVHIETKDEDEFLKGFQKAFTDRTVAVHFWLGMTDTETEGVWRWYDNNSTATYLDWISGEPNDVGGAEDCALLSWYQHYSWVDVPCTLTGRALCEKRHIY